MFPLYDSVKTKVGGFPIITLLLVIANIIVFFLELTASDTDAFIQHYALVPSQINVSNFSTLYPFVSAMFLHGGFLHIISNMWFLWVFGDDIEKNLGKIPYLALYFLAGIIGNFVQYLLAPTSTVPMLGASGAVAGVLGAYFLLFPTAKIKTLIFIFVFITLLDIPAYLMLGYWFILQLFNGFGSIHANPDAGGIAFWAHVSGFILGLLFAKIFGRREVSYVEGQVVS